jgi:hypothetical protein
MTPPEGYALTRISISESSSASRDRGVAPQMPGDGGDMDGGAMAWIWRRALRARAPPRVEVETA